MNLTEIITMEPGKRGGKPYIRGMWITVYDVLSYLAAGMTHGEILSDFPYLTEEAGPVSATPPTVSSTPWSLLRETPLRSEPVAAPRHAAHGEQ